MRWLYRLLFSWRRLIDGLLGTQRYYRIRKDSLAEYAEKKGEGLEVILHGERADIPRADRVRPGLYSRASVRDFDKVDEAIRSLPFGQMAFNAPEHLELGEMKELKLVISLLESIQQLKERIASGDPALGAKIQMSSRMGANLKGAGFEITPVSHEVQAISGEEVTAWQWRVTPTAKGTQTLRVYIYMLVQIDGESTPRELHSFEHALRVKVNLGKATKAFVIRNWQWLAATIVIPLIGVAYSVLTS